MSLGAIMVAPWGRYVVHHLSPLVLRDLSRSNAYVLPCAGSEDYVAIGETLSPALPRALSDVGKDSGPTQTVAALSAIDSHDLFEAIQGSVKALPERACLGTAGPDLQPGPTPPDPWWMEFVRAPAHPMDPLTLGGMRPGTGLGLIPSKPRLLWSPCVVRDASGEPHVWYLAMSDDQSLRCWECRVGRATYKLIPKGTQPELERVWPTEADIVARAALSAAASSLESTGAPNLSLAEHAPGLRGTPYAALPAPDIVARAATLSTGAKSFESAGTPVGDSPGHAHASGGGHDRPGESTAAGNVAEPQIGTPGSAAPVTCALTSSLSAAAAPPPPKGTGKFSPSPPPPLYEKRNTDDVTPLPPLRALWPTVVPPPFRPRTQSEWYEEWGERAAVFEHLGGYSRQVSEQMAADLLKSTFGHPSELQP